MNYYFNKINYNYSDTICESPFYTFTRPPECNNEEFARYNLDISQWQVFNKSDKDFYFNFDTLEYKYLDYYEAQNFDFTNYHFGLIKNEGDVINYLANKIEYTVASQATLSFFKRKKVKKIRELYIQSQIAKIVNGIEFYTSLAGKFYTEIVPLRKIKATSRDDELMYIRITATDGIDYEGNLPIDFYNVIDKSLDVISIENNKTEALLYKKLQNLQTVQEIIDMQINFLPIQDFNINNIADIFIADNKYRQEDRDYIASLNKKFFKKFENEKY